MDEGKSREEFLEELALLRRQLDEERAQSNIQADEIKKLRAESDFATNLINTAQVIVLLLSQQGNILYLNPFMENLSGYDLNEVRGKAWFDIFLSPGDRERVRELFGIAIQGDHTQGNINPIVIRDGTERVVEWYDTTIKNDSGFLELLSVGVDVTKRVIAEGERDDYRERLEQSLTKVLGGFIPICANCKMIRNDEDRWERLESYIGQRTGAEFTHSICPLCAIELYPDIDL